VERGLVWGAFDAAAWSPDGTRLGFLRSVPYGPEPLVITDARGHNACRLARNASGFAWLADGRRLAYVGSGALYVAKADGSNPVRIASNVGYLAWSPDAQLLAYDTPAMV
jgi:Tol biopolymer transport system component